VLYMMLLHLYWEWTEGTREKYRVLEYFAIRLTYRSSCTDILSLKAIPDENALQRQFTAHDPVNGFLHLDGFTNLVASLGLHFGQNETEAASIDSDNDGQISYEDFKT